MPHLIKIAKQGVDAQQTNNPNDFIFHTEYNTFKIIAKGTLLAQTVDADPKTFTLAHNQGKIPAFYGFCKFPDGAIALPNESDKPGGGGTTALGRFYMEADDTNLYFVMDKIDGADFDVDFAWYVFESALT